MKELKATFYAPVMNFIEHVIGKGCGTNNGNLIGKLKQE